MSTPRAVNVVTETDTGVVTVSAPVVVHSVVHVVEVIWPVTSAENGVISLVNAGIDVDRVGMICDGMIVGRIDVMVVQGDGVGLDHDQDLLGSGRVVHGDDL